MLYNNYMLYNIYMLCKHRKQCTGKNRKCSCYITDMNLMHVMVTLTFL